MNSLLTHTQARTKKFILSSRAARLFTSGSSLELSLAVLDGDRNQARGVSELYRWATNDPITTDLDVEQLNSEDEGSAAWNDAASATGTVAERRLPW